MITTDPGGKAIRQDHFYPFQDAARYGRILLKGAARLPKAATCHHGEQETVTTACVYNEEQKEITVFAMNCEMQEDVKLRLVLWRLRQHGGALRGVRLYDDDPYAKNTFDEEFRVEPEGKRADGRIGRRNGSYFEEAFLECAALEAEITQAAH